jgi:cell wall assembly regulator SMI1
MSIQARVRNVVQSMEDTVEHLNLGEYMKELNSRLTQAATTEFVQTKGENLNLRLMNHISNMIDSGNMTEEDIEVIIKNQTRLEFVFHDGTYTASWDFLVKASTDELEAFKEINPLVASQELPEVEGLIRVNETR